MTQLSLLLIGGTATAPLWFAKPKRRTSVRRLLPLAPWRQLKLRLYIRPLIRKGNYFTWTRPDGRQFVCRNLRSLVARVMDYDGRLLQGLLKTVSR